MLGKLARWLRIMGYDTTYNPEFTDDDLFFKAHLEKRILLTRDTELASRMNSDYCFYVASQNVKTQLKQIINKFGLNIKDSIFTRCTICNELVASISKKDVKDKVPLYVYNTTNDFFYCKKCNKFYWAGSHIKKVKQILIELDETIKKRN